MIPLTSILLLILGFASGKVMTKGFLSPFLDGSGGVLLVYLITFVGFFLSLRGGQTIAAERRRFWVIVVTTIFLVGMVTWRQSLVRLTNFSLIHDGAIQTEVAADFLLHGVNPYVADFRPTPFGDAPSPYRPDAVNLAWTHYAYPPAVFLTAVPSILLRPWLGALTDLRWLYLGSLLVLTAAVAWRATTWERRSQAVLLLAVNPFVWLYAVAGFNDILSVTAMVVSAILLERKKWSWGGILFGLALATKQTAWLALPLWVAWIWQSSRMTNTSRREFASALLAMSGTVAIAFGPFIVWNPAALYDDLIRYVSGTIPFSYPISGSTWLQFLRIFGFVDSAWASVRTWPIQLLAFVATTWVGWRWVLRRPTASSWLAGATITTLAVAMVSRFFNDNYLSAIVALGVSAYYLHHDQTGSR